MPVLQLGEIWKLSRIEFALREAIDASGRENGTPAASETVTALRQKINEVELFCRNARGAAPRPA
jgi:hypothetical protein